MGALGFEPRSAGFFRLACTRLAHALGLRRVGAPVAHQSHQNTSSSSFPCNWSPRYYQVILYPQGWLRERFPSYDALGPEMCQKENAKSPIEILISVQTPIIATETPHALGRIPTLSRPMIAAYFPSKRGSDLNIETTNPAEIPNPISINGERALPRMPDLAIDPTPCAIIEGSMIQVSQASHNPR